jgi:hypothetical protein
VRKEAVHFTPALGCTYTPDSASIEGLSVLLTIADRREGDGSMRSLLG